HVHAAGVALDRRVDKPVDLGEGDDVVELAGDLAPRHAEDGAVEEDVFPAGQLGMEPGPDFQKAADLAAQLDAAGRRLGDAAEDLQEGRFAGAVAADDAHDLPRLDLEGNVAQGPQLG